MGLLKNKGLAHEETRYIATGANHGLQAPSSSSFYEAIANRPELNDEAATTVTSATPEQPF